MQVDFDDLFIKTHISHHLEVLDEAATSFRSEHIFVIKARGRCRFFARRIHWTGGDSINAPDIICEYDQWGHPKHRLHGPLIKEGRWLVWLIDLGRTLDAGEEEMVHFRQTLYDLEGTFKPHLACGIAHGGVESVTLTVTLPPSYNKEVRYSESVRSTEHVLSSEVLDPMTELSGPVYQKVRNLHSTETNMNLRIDWSLHRNTN